MRLKLVLISYVHNTLMIDGADARRDTKELEDSSPMKSHRDTPSKFETESYKNDADTNNLKTKGVSREYL